MATARSDRGMTSAQKNRLPRTRFAFPDERKEPLTDAAHVRNALARFDQVEGVTDAERDRAWKRIRAAAREVRRRDLGPGMATIGQRRQEVTEPGRCTAIPF